MCPPVLSCIREEVKRHEDRRNRCRHRRPDRGPDCTGSERRVRKRRRGSCVVGSNSNRGHHRRGRGCIEAESILGTERKGTEELPQSHGAEAVRGGMAAPSTASILRFLTFFRASCCCNLPRPRLKRAYAVSCFPRGAEPFHQEQTSEGVKRGKPQR